MATPRSSIVNLDNTPFYHCISRCVRQGYLCGFDKEKNKDFSHRKGWIVQRLKALSSIFAIDICAYAIMSNHYHLVLHINKEKAENWKAHEVIERWQALFPQNAKLFAHVAKKVNLWRDRLSDISWFMRCLNEKIATWANAEDGSKGRFWEGRFKSQAILDEGALLSTMAYVDLNPIRAGIASTPEESEFTSIFERIQAAKLSLQTHSDNVFENLNLHQPKSLMPLGIASSSNATNNWGAILNINFEEYLQLIDETGRVIRDDKRGAIPVQLKPILDRLKIRTHKWIGLMNNLLSYFGLAIGAENKLIHFSSSKRKIVKGASSARSCYIMV